MNTSTEPGHQLRSPTTMELGRLETERPPTRFEEPGMAGRFRTTRRRNNRAGSAAKPARRRNYNRPGA